MAAPQYAFRAQKASGLVDGPSWQAATKIPLETSGVKCHSYSPNGEWFAYALPAGVHLLASSSSSTSEPILIDQPNVVALSFSPLSTFLFTFERPIKSDTDVHKNVKVWEVATGMEVGSWYNKGSDDWVPVITPDEAHLIRAASSDLTIYTPPSSPRPSVRLRVDGQIRGLFLSKPSALPATSTSSKPFNAHSEPALAVWVGEKKGAPATVALYPLSTLLGSTVDSDKTETRDMPMTTARKAFYKADKLTVKWNNAGTMALFLAQTDVDNTGKSYYGETNLYLVGLDGSFDGLVDLDKEGPIYDFSWSPTSREFVVCYGYMPARVQLYDTKIKPVHSFGAQHRNFVLYQPQGRLLLTAGFGNLAGGVDIWDVSTRNKVAEFKSPNSSHCEWSPCGRYILTATLSPRLRVDNGMKIWWCGGQLLHIHPQDELYQATFQPTLLADVPAFPSVVPAAPEPNESITLFRPKGDNSSAGGEAKPSGAYRPPGARGTTASTAYLRDEDGNSSGATTPTPMFKGGKPYQRYIPGSIPGAPPGAGSRNGNANGNGTAHDEKKKRVRTKRPAKENGAGTDTLSPGEIANGGLSPAEPPTEEMSKVAVTDIGEATNDAVAKKLRNLTKKLKAIEDLKSRQAGGEALEKTQLQKITTEGSIRGEIATLGGEA